MLILVTFGTVKAIGIVLLVEVVTVIVVVDVGVPIDVLMVVVTSKPPVEAVVVSATIVMLLIAVVTSVSVGFASVDGHSVISDDNTVIFVSIPGMVFVISNGTKCV